MMPGRQYALLPVAPVTGSNVPGLTSLYSRAGRGPYGDARYRGNCSGYLIRDLLRFYRSTTVLDLMRGSGTCGDACRELSLPYFEMDVKHGQDAADPASYAGLPMIDFAWAHPPYWRQIVYSDDPRCLSNAPTRDDFLDRMQTILRLAKGVLTPNGKIAVLIGNYSDRGRYQPLSHLLVERAIREGLWLACTEIIRWQHGNTSSRKQYRSSFIPGLHDTCLIFESLSTHERKPQP
ncbi:hypothetical protein Pan44_52780 [Caulifigura coniformis]|uniref:DNA methylase n=1 Tax=Caulifigura coniformis TaxID=2527983 RepID=A0A517SM71_9PLAN|nr:site-specific DNA-methyltransferase [Caulifigura coniformis]QDT57211.1 hypothetical protein Pan44_52780 [Caulifigura coniformis]